MKQIFFNLTFSILLLLNSSVIFAQKETPSIDAISEKSGDTLSLKNKIGLSAGILGTNFAYTRKINDRLSARLDFNIYNENFTFNDKFDFGGIPGNVSLDVKNTTLNLALEYLPFKNHKSLKLIVGLNYLYNLELKSTAISIKDRNYGDIPITPQDIGVFKCQINWKGFGNYFAMGYETNLYKNISFGFELGGAYIPNPEIKFDSTKMLVRMSDIEQDDFRNWVNQFHVLPNLKVSLAYRFSDPRFKFSKKDKSKK